MRSLFLLAPIVACALAQGCAPAMPEAPIVETSTTLTPSSASAATPTESARVVTPMQAIEGELTPSAEVTFEVRPLNGPGTMGPTVLASSSDAVLEEIRGYLAAHPDEALRIETRVNPLRMSSSPDASWPAGLSLQIARWLVDHGIDCARLDAVGALDRELGPKERVRFFNDPKRHAHSPEEEAHRDACKR